MGHAYGSTLTTPTISATAPRLGNLLTISGSDAEIPLVFLMLGLPVAEQPYLTTGISFYVGSPSLIALNATGGSWSQPLLVPNLPQLSGVAVAVQALVPQVLNPVTVSTTESLQLVIGN